MGELPEGICRIRHRERNRCEISQKCHCGRSPSLDYGLQIPPFTLFSHKSIFPLSPGLDCSTAGSGPGQDRFWEQVQPGQPCPGPGCPLEPAGRCGGARPAGGSTGVRMRPLRRPDPRGARGSPPAREINDIKQGKEPLFPSQDGLFGRGGFGTAQGGLFSPGGVCSIYWERMEHPTEGHRS